MRHPVRDPDGIICFDGLGSDIDDVGASGDFQVILSDDAVIRGRDGQGCGSVQRQIRFGKDYTIGVGVSVGNKRSCDREGVVGVCCDKHFVGALYVDHGEAFVRDGYAVQNQLNLVILSGFHIDGHVGCLAAEHIDAGGADGDILSVRDGIIRRFGQIHGLFQIAVGKLLVRCINGGGAFRRAQGHGQGDHQNSHDGREYKAINTFHGEIPSFLTGTFYQAKL